jgi:hypothetical protein
MGFNGGRADISYLFTQHFAMVGEYSGTHSDLYNVTNNKMNLLTIMAGPRFLMTFKDAKGKPGRFTPFAQFLVGDARGSAGAFPVNGTLQPTAECLSMAFGGGLDVSSARTRRVSFRVLQVDYLNTQLPNLYGTHQNYFRIGASVVYRLR